MKKTLFALAFIALAIFNQSCKQKDVVSGIIVSKEIPITEYSIISSALPANIIYEQKEGPAYLKLDIDQSILDKLDIVVKDSVLQLNLKSGISLNLKTDKWVVRTNSKSLKLVSLTSAGNFNLKNLSGVKRLDVRLEGAGNFEAENLDCVSFALTLSGAGNAKVKGRAEAAAYNLSGVGNVKAEEFDVKSLRVFLSGVGNAKVNATDYLYVGLKGAGNVEYKGKPKKLETDIQGVGKVRQL
jgi:Putative auto-transporter adhesin, head GIN domain